MPRKRGKQRRQRKSRKQRTDAELKAAAKHVHYECKMLYFTGAQNYELPDGLESNAMIEAFGTHARNLIHFFGHKRGDTHPDDVLVEEFLPSWRLQGKLPNGSPVAPGKFTTDFITTLMQRFNRSLAHISDAETDPIKEDLRSRHAEEERKQAQRRHRRPNWTSTRFAVSISPLKTARWSRTVGRAISQKQ
jgi:hypothetical protein